MFLSKCVVLFHIMMLFSGAQLRSLPATMTLGSVCVEP